MKSVSVKTIDELEELCAKVDQVLDRLMDVLDDDDTESGGSWDDLRTDLRVALEEAYSSTEAALESVGLETALQQLGASRGGRRQVPTNYTVEYRDETGFRYVACPAREAIRFALQALRVRRVIDSEQEARLEKLEREKRQEQREDAKVAQQSQRTSTMAAGLIGVVGTLAGALVGKVSCDAGPPPVHVLQITGQIYGLDSGAVAAVECAPTLQGVHVAVGGDSFTVIAESSVPRPVCLFCRAKSGERASAPVPVCLPSHGAAEAPVLELLGASER